MSITSASMTVPQRWKWHAEVYALRRVVLGVPPGEHTSPCDPNGQWYDEAAVAAAEASLRARFAEQSRRCAADTATANAIRFADADAWRRRAYPDATVAWEAAE
jgi:hypothetical protein